ncbi:MAG: ABC transporter ATP-binding protein [Alphaproteobacteria bacterium]
MNEAGGPVLTLSKVSRTFDQAGQKLRILRQVSLSVNGGEMVALVGPSGAGKSTLLHIAGLLERPNKGDVTVNGASCARMREAERTRLRRELLGFVYQFHHLLPEFSALENVMLPQLIAGARRAEAKARAEELLALVGLSDRESHRPARLSGGEQQRVAIVRAIANKPRILFADEPTGNLDPGTAADVFQQLSELVHATGLATLVATHNMELARRMDRVLALKAGRVEQVSV